MESKKLIARLIDYKHNPWLQPYNLLVRQSGNSIRLVGRQAVPTSVTLIGCDCRFFEVREARLWANRAGRENLFTRRRPIPAAVSLFLRGLHTTEPQWSC